MFVVIILRIYVISIRIYCRFAVEVIDLKQEMTSLNLRNEVNQSSSSEDSKDTSQQSEVVKKVAEKYTRLEMYGFFFIIKIVLLLSLLSLSLLLI
jgi:cell division protein FtsL